MTLNIRLHTCIEFNNDKPVDCTPHQVCKDIYIDSISLPCFADTKVVWDST